MRFARFDLTAFGHFTGTSLAFPAGATDLHVVYGPNEAGKSTLRAALLDWFYGIHGQTPYGFKHRYAKLELSGLIEDPALGSLQFRRFKRLKNPVQDHDGNPLPDTELARWLLRTDRESYRRMFAIDHEQLIAGEEAITDAQNDIGRILFGAAAGLGNLGELPAKIDGEAEDLWDPHKKKDHQYNHQYTQAEARFLAARAKLAAVSLSAAQWQEARNALDAARSAEAAVEAELAGYGRRQRQLARVTRVAAPLAHWRDATAERQGLGTPVAFPDDAAVTFAAAEKTLGSAQVKRDLATEALTGGKQALAALTLCLALTERSDDIDRLADRVAAMREEIATFTADAQALVAARAPDLAGKSAVEAALALKQRANAEKNLVAEHGRLTKAVSDAQGRLAAIAEEEAEARATVAPLMATTKAATLEEPLFSFLHPEPLRLLGELDSDATSHQRREEIGLRLAQMGDPRRGVGLDANGCPDIATVFGCVVRPPSNSRFAALLIARHLAVASFGPLRAL